MDDLGRGGGDGSGSESEGSNSPSLRRDLFGSRKRAAQRTPAQPSKRGAGDAVKIAAKVFVRGVMSVTSDGKHALFAVGPKTKDELARDGKSLLAVYEFLVEKAPPPKTFQAEVDALPGAFVMSKLLNGKRLTPPP